MSTFGVKIMLRLVRAEVNVQSFEMFPMDPLIPYMYKLRQLSRAYG